jgi:tetratricopeptide (TPR) repeat protein
MWIPDLPERVKFACSAWLFVFLAAIMITGCGGYGSLYTPHEMREIIEMRQMMEDEQEQREAFYRKIESTLNSIQKAQENDQLVSKELLDDVLSHLRRHEEETERTKSMLDLHAHALDRISQRMGFGTAGKPQDRRETYFPPDREHATEEPVPSYGQSALDQAISNAHNDYNLGNFSEARENFEIALDLDPDAGQKIEILFWLGDTCDQLDELEDARRYYSDLIKSNAAHTKAWVSFERLANIRCKQGDMDAALNMLNSIVKDHPGYPDIERVKSTIADIKQDLRHRLNKNTTPGDGQPVPPVQ